MSTGKLVVICFVGTLAITGMAMAVGLKRIDLNGDQLNSQVVASVQSAKVVQSQSDFYSLVERCPLILEDTLEMVKDLLSQFGIVDRKEP
jgi:hypothetical protein